MIEVICREETLIYNAYHMTKAFYPSAEAVSRLEEKASNYVTVKFPEDEETGGRSGAAEREITVSEEDVQRISGSDAELSSDKKKRKYCVDIALYRKLQERSKRTLAWGILMGVRPTKLAMEKLNEGMEEAEFTGWFERECLVSREKALLSRRIVEREKALLDRLDLKNGYSLYVGIPFCPTVCAYCSFSSGPLAQWKDRVDDYVSALCKELSFVAEACRGRRLNTVYIGGGTPTSLSAGQLERLLSHIDSCFSREWLLEYTVEAGRPDSITEEKLKVIRKHGITRISVNPQTMQQKTLDLIGRKHTVEDIRSTFLLARGLGFDNINMDLIAGLPGETPDDMRDTLKKVEALAPDNLTVHSLALKRAAKGGQRQTKEYEEALRAAREGKHEGERIEEMIREARLAAERMEMSPYYLYRQKNIAGNFENVGYAKVDKAGIYNILIMEEKQSIVAVGAGAITKLVLDHMAAAPGSGKLTNLMRQENVKAIDAYIGRIDEMIERKGEYLWL